MNGVFIAATTTDENGVYTFENLPVGTFNVQLSTDLEGATVGMQDALSILMYLYGIIEYTPMQKLAMDVNGNGSVGFSDFTYIVVQYFIFNQPFPVGDWVFEDATITVGSRDGGNTIGGSRTGDSEGVLVPTGRDLVVNNQLAASETMNVSGDEILEIPVFANTDSQSIAGYGLVLGFDPQYIEVLSVEPFGKEAHSATLSGEIRMSWVNNELPSKVPFDGKLAVVKVKLLNGYKPQNEFAFDVKGASHILNGEGTKIGNTQYSMPELVSNTMTTSLYPNPAVDFTRLNISIEQNLQSELTVYAITGQLIRSETLFLTKGNQNISIPVENLRSGLYYVMLSNTQTNQVLFNEKLVKK